MPFDIARPTEVNGDSAPYYPTPRPPRGPGRGSTAKEFATIIATLRDRLFVLPDETWVYPGHGDDHDTRSGAWIARRVATAGLVRVADEKLRCSRRRDWTQRPTIPPQRVSG